MRTAAFINDSLVTAGEDATLKLWRKDHLKFTLREHLGPVYTMAVSQDYTFTAGAEGVIRRWKNQDLLNGKASDLEEDFHDEPIWALAIREKLNLLLVSSADQTLQLLKNSS